MTADLEERFRQRAHEIGLGRGRTLLAVSGGMDSVVLLHLAHRLLPAQSFHVAHFDHAWRADSASDAEFVATLCARLGVTCSTARSLTSVRSETRARSARHAFLRATAASFDCRSIALAHHADDQAETVLFRSARGATTRGLRGMRACAGPLIRPLLSFRRSELEAYARGRGLEWREDSTNRDVRFSRNRIRHVLLPALERAAPGATERLLEIARLADTAERAWEEVVKDVHAEAVSTLPQGGFQLASTPWLGYHPHIRARALRSLCRSMGRSVQRSGILRAEQFVRSGRSGARVQIARDVWLAREFDRFLLRTRPAAMVPDTRIPIPSADTGSAEAVIGGRRVSVCWTAGAWTGEGVRFDVAALRFPLELRGWEPGDRIHVGAGTRKVKKVFTERRVGRSARAAVPVLAEAGSRTVLWLAGIQQSDVAAPRAGSPVFSIRIEE